MPRSKTRKPRKAVSLSTSETQRRLPSLRDAAKATSPARHRRVDLRPPKFPGRLGGR